MPNSAKKALNPKKNSRKQAASKRSVAGSGSGKSSREVTKKKPSTSARKVTRRKKQTGFHGGSYITPNGNVSVGLPAFWTLRQTNDDLEVDSPSGATSVVVTAFQREKGFARLDARDYLERFMQTVTIQGRAQTGQNGHQRALSRYRDQEGNQWQVQFLTDGDTLLLATMSSSVPARSREAQEGAHILGTIKLS